MCVLYRSCGRRKLALKKEFIRKKKKKIKKANQKVLISKVRKKRDFDL